MAEGFEKIAEGAYFIVDPQYFLISITPYDHNVANQMICYGWEEPIAELPLMENREPTDKGEIKGA